MVLALTLGFRVCSEPVTVTLYNTGDMHEATRNLSRIARFVRDRKARDPNTLLFDVGDLFNRGDLGLMVTRGEGMIATMAAAGYDACILGNHGGSFGTLRIASLIDRFHYPLLCANAVWPQGHQPKDAPSYRIFALDGVRVGVIGALAEHRNHRCDDLLGLKRVDEAVAPLVPEVRRQADIVVLLTHVGTKRDRQIAAALHSKGAAVDVILGGHDHAAFKEPVVEPTSDTLIQHSGSMGAVLGEVVLVWDGQRITDRRVRIVPIENSLPEDPDVKAVRDHYLQTFAADQPVAALAADLPRSDLSLWLAQELLRVTEADVALVPGELAAKALPVGDASARSVTQAVPRLALTCFTVPDRTGLNDLLVKLWRKHASLVAYGPAVARAKRPIRVVYPCVAYDRVVPSTLDELTAAGAQNLARLEDASLWQVALEAARSTHSIQLPILR